jgi:hypothetical protein
MKKWFADQVGQVWTVIGMLAAWIFAAGSGKTILGYLILAGIVIWAASYWIRNEGDKE